MMKKCSPMLCGFSRFYFLLILVSFFMLSSVAFARAIDENETSSLAVTVSQTGASIYLDGKLLGQSPLDTVKGIKPGEHTLTIRAKGFKTYKKKLSMTPGDTAQVTAFLESAKGGKLVVVSMTKDAMVFIDDFQIGTVPLEKPLALEPGKHEIKVTKLGFTAFSKKIKIKKGKKIKVQADLLAFAGILDVRASVPGARIYVDGKEAGVVPLEKEIFVGEHEVEVKKDGYTNYRKKLKVAAGRSYSINAQLNPLHQPGPSLAETQEGVPASSGETSLEVNPETLNKEKAGKGPVALKIPQPGKQPSKVEEGPGAWYTRWWFWTAVAVVVAASIAVPIGVEQGSSSSGGGVKLPHTDVPDINLP
ncbi:MAG: PEGA domain-containing protein [Deltaproteobacteria bacterium]|nr:PEGA domain-containing protein [Deltaproteobacteria bacterium]